MNFVKKNTGAQLDSSKGVCLEVNARNQSKCSCLVTRMQNKVKIM
jgi:hypothetical protein